ncbi:hypothetical protein L5515_008181 [Caenorhabditis briggsae]|uniref:Uncharacterized protein n=1 Tax=Caenorhabditis briggsae TaxID=6238 RepID=A0AAE9F597_CAEBR|nr:hypothetical protein L5515_008181 [Caenorhabditis briggsae]
MVRRRLDDFKQILEQECLDTTIDKCNQAFEKFLSTCIKGKFECQKEAEKGKEQFCQEHSYSDYCISSTASPTTPNSTTISTTTTTSFPTTSLTETTAEESFVLTPIHYIIGAGIGGFLILGLVLLVKWILDKKKPAKKQKKTKKKHPEFTIESPSKNFTRSRTW